MRYVYIWIDDMRDPPTDIEANVYLHARNYFQAVNYIQRYSHYGYHITVDFDHDLGEGKNGYDVAKYIVEHNIQNLYFYVHSMNPVGRANIIQLLTHYGHNYLTQNKNYAIIFTERRKNNG